MSKYLFLVLWVCAFGCRSQQIDCSQKTVEDISWLKNMVKGKEKAKVFVFQDSDSSVFEVHLCYQCPDAMVMYYNCAGKKICESGGFTGRNTCPEFDAVERKKIYPTNK